MAGFVRGPAAPFSGRLPGRRRLAASAGYNPRWHLAHAHRGFPMARGINKVILVGTLGKDPEVRYAQSGSAITSVSLATNEKWKDKNGEMQERTEWHRV